MSDLWLIEYEQASEQFQSGWIEEGAFRQTLKCLGFDDNEIDDEVAVARGDI